MAPKKGHRQQNCLQVVGVAIAASSAAQHATTATSGLRANFEDCKYEQYFSPLLVFVQMAAKQGYRQQNCLQVVGVAIAASSAAQHATTATSGLRANFEDCKYEQYFSPLLVFVQMAAKQGYRQQNCLQVVGVAIAASSAAQHATTATSGLRANFKDCKYE